MKFIEKIGSVKTLREILQFINVIKNNIKPYTSHEHQVETYYYLSLIYDREKENNPSNLFFSLASMSLGIFNKFLELKLI